MFRNRAVYKLGRISHEVIRHAKTCRLAVEGEGSHGGTGIRGIPGQCCVGSKTHLMVSVDHAEIVVTREHSAPGRAALSADGEPAGYGDSRIMRRVEVSLDTDVGRSETLFGKIGYEFAGCNSVCGQPESIHEIRAK